MRRWEQWLGLVAVVLASLSVIGIGGRGRLLFALSAIALLIVIAVLQLRRVPLKRREQRYDAYERALRIQEDRERKFHR